jgi:hypothetical protein
VTARNQPGQGSRPPLDDLRVRERSGELDAEPGVGGGIVRAEPVTAADQLNLGVAIVRDYRTGIYYVSTSSS